MQATRKFKIKYTIVVCQEILKNPNVVNLLKHWFHELIITLCYRVTNCGLF